MHYYCYSITPYYPNTSFCYSTSFYSMIILLTDRKFKKAYPLVIYYFAIPSNLKETAYKQAPPLTACRCALLRSITDQKPHISPITYWKKRTDNSLNLLLLLIRKLKIAFIIGLKSQAGYKDDTLDINEIMFVVEFPNSSVDYNYSAYEQSSWIENKTNMSY